MTRFDLPVDYDSLDRYDRRLVREQYIKEQAGNCWFCKTPLSGDPSQDVLDKTLNLHLFPEGFLTHPVHLHHSHVTGLTLGAVHAKCNGVLWQYYGE